MVGVGYSDVTRRGEPDIRTLTLDAALDALDDAGLRRRRISTRIFEYSFGMMRGDSPIAVGAQRLLGVPNLTAFNDIMGTGPSGLASAMDAAMAISAGACETALVYRTITREAGHNGALREGTDRGPGQMQFAAPYGYGGGIILAMAMKKRRRIAELGGSVEDYGQIALNARRWAALNPRAMFRDPITMDDYLDSRVIADPLLLFDCDYPVNAACAAILTTAERAADLAPARGARRRARLRHREPARLAVHRRLPLRRHDPVRAGAVARGRRSPRPTSTSPSSTTASPTSRSRGSRRSGSAGSASSTTGSTTARAIGPGGSMPLNTYGGQLAAGRMHGLAFLNEAVLQVRGGAGDRQVPDARRRGGRERARPAVRGDGGPGGGVIGVARSVRESVLEAPPVGRRADPTPRRVGPAVDVDRGSVDVGAHRRAQEHRGGGAVLDHTFPTRRDRAQGAVRAFGAALGPGGRVDRARRGCRAVPA